MPVTFHVRYVGCPKARRMIIQRSDDHSFWGGDGWVEEVKDALLYRNLRDAQRDAVAFQKRYIEGKPRREFRCEFRVTLHGEEVTGADADDVIEYLRKLMLIGIDYEGVEADGPLAECHVVCTVKLDGLKEVQ